MNNVIDGTDIEYKLRTNWGTLVDSITNRTKYNNIYPYVFSDAMIYVIIHKASREFYCAYKKMTGKNDNYSSFVFFNNIGMMKANPGQYELYATEYWYGEQGSNINEDSLRLKVVELTRRLENNHHYTISPDIDTFCRYTKIINF